MFVISPFTRNQSPNGPPLVCSDPLDHTSMLRFVETWASAIGKPAPIPNRDAATLTPGLSAWRRTAVRDLTGAFNFAAPADASAPSTVLTIVPNRADPTVLAECTLTGTIGSESGQTSPIVQDPPVPKVMNQPVQEPLATAVRRPSGVCAAAAPIPVTTPAASVAPNQLVTSGRSGGLPATGALPAPGVTRVLTVAGALAAAGLGWRRRRMEAISGSAAAGHRAADGDGSEGSGAGDCGTGVG
jgi:hypothetical protein